MEYEKLSNVCVIRNGFAFKSTEFLKEGIPLLRISNFDNGEVFINDKTVYVNSEFLNTKSDFIVEKGDVLIALSGATTGKYGIYNLTYPSLLNQRIGIIKSGRSNQMNSRFFYYYLDVLKSEILRKAGGAAQPNISTKTIGEMKIPLPPLPEQKRIAAILDQADKVRQLNKKLIQKYEALTQSLFLDMFGDPVMNPKGWEKVEFSKICSFKKKSVLPENIKTGTSYIGLECIQKETGDIVEVFNVKNGEIKSNKFWFNSDYILYGKLRPYLNKVALPLFEGVCSTDIIPIKPIIEKTNRFFISTIMRNKGFVSFADERSSGANLPRISPKEIEKYQVINPPITLQNIFAKRIKEIEKQKALAQKSLKKSEELFNALLQKAFLPADRHGKGELIN